MLSNINYNHSYCSLNQISFSTILARVKVRFSTYSLLVDPIDTYYYYPIHNSIIDMKSTVPYFKLLSTPIAIIIMDDCTALSIMTSSGQNIIVFLI